MIQIYVMDISKLKEKEYFERAYALSDLRRQQKADALNTAAGKACCIGAGLLLSFVLKKWGIFLKDEVLEYNEYLVIGNVPILIGDTTTNLTNYVTLAELEEHAAAAKALYATK